MFAEEEALNKILRENSQALELFFLKKDESSLNLTKPLHPPPLTLSLSTNKKMSFVSFSQQVIISLRLRFVKSIISSKKYKSIKYLLSNLTSIAELSE
jgi:hypothetical protein